MEMHAYPSEYLAQAQRNLGDMIDFAVNSCDMDIDKFFSMFLVSDISIQFQNGNPAYIAGKTGCELARKVVVDVGMSDFSEADEMYMDKSPEYWTGWALAYYQWYTSRTFSRINSVIKASGIRMMYDIYHEMDIMHFVERINEIWDDYYKETNLKRLRKTAGLSQTELAKLSGVALRQIQLFEQKQRDINKTRAMDVYRLAKVIGCKTDELLEI